MAREQPRALRVQPGARRGLGLEDGELGGTLQGKGDCLESQRCESPGEQASAENRCQPAGVGCDVADLTRVGQIEQVAVLS